MALKIPNSWIPLNRGIRAIQVDQEADLVSLDTTGSGSSTWGSISGTLSNQTDLQSALNAKASTSYVDGLVVGLLDDRGSYNASSNTFPTTGGSGTAGAILKGDLWYVSVAGTLGGSAVNVGDSFRALVDSPGQTAANWSILESNLGFVPAPVASPTFTGTVTIPTLILTDNSSASTPAAKATGTWYSGGSATTTKPHILIEPTGTTSANWSTSGTGLGINAASGFAGNFFNAQLNGADILKIYQSGGNTTVIDGGNSRLKITTTTGVLTLNDGNGDVTLTSTGFAIGATRTTSSGTFVANKNQVVSEPGISHTGTWFSGGSSTTTKPLVLLEPSGTTSTNWDTAGTVIGVNAASGYTGTYIDMKLNNSSTSIFKINNTYLYTLRAIRLGGNLDEINDSGGSGHMDLNCGAGNVRFQNKTWTDTTGTAKSVSIPTIFAPTSGSAVFNAFTVEPVINQVGATGNTRGVYINPTYTSVGGQFRALSINTPSGTEHYFRTSGHSLLMGNSAIGDVVTINNSNNVTWGQYHIFQATHVASTPLMTFNPTWFTGGTSTTTKPVLLIEPTGTTSTAWSTSGTGLGINAANAFAGNLIDAQVNGSSKFSVSSAGTVVAVNFGGTGNVQLGTSGTLYWSGSTAMTAPSDGVLKITDTAGTAFGRIQLGGTTSSFPAIKRNGGAIDFRLADDSTYTTITAGINTANTITPAAASTFVANSSGTAANGFGATILFQAETSTTNSTDMANIGAIWTDAAHATRTSAVVLYGTNSAGAIGEIARVKSATAPTLSIASAMGTAGTTTYADAGITTGVNYTIGGASNSVTLSTSGAVILTTSGTTAGILRLNITDNGASSAASIQVGTGATYTQTSSSRSYMDFNYNFSPTSGTAVHNQLSFTGTLNQTGGANGIVRGINLAHTVTAVADYRAIEIADNGSNVKGIYQTGATTTNNFVGKTAFGSTTAPSDMVTVTGNIVVAGQNVSTRFALTDAATIALDWNNGNVQSVTLGGNRTFTFASPKDGGDYLIAIKQDATGSRTIAWPANVKWPGGVAPTLTTTAGRSDLFRFLYTGTDYFGYTVGLNFQVT